MGRRNSIVLRIISITFAVIVGVYVMYFLTRTRSSNYFIPLSDVEAKDVKNLVLFIGYQHSGHSIIGSMMDAHPNIIIAHEFMLLNTTLPRSRTTLYNTLYDNSFHVAKSGWRKNTHKIMGYALDVPNGYQGTFTELKVIGDKAGGESAMKLATEQQTWQKLKILQDLVGVPVKFIHVVRNPYDMIATDAVNASYVGKHRTSPLRSAKQKLPEEVLMTAVNRYVTLAMGVSKLQEEPKKFDVLEIHLVDFIHNPKATLQEICQFLDLNCTISYLQACSNKAFKVISRSRHLIEWPSEAIIAIDDMIESFPFFRRYSSDN